MSYVKDKSYMRVTPAEEVTNLTVLTFAFTCAHNRERENFCYYSLLCATLQLCCCEHLSYSRCSIVNEY